MSSTSEDKGASSESMNISFIWQAWLDQFQLNEHTVMDYFKHSPFYDKTCNNEVLAMQNKDQRTIVNMSGLEYALDTDVKGAYVIRKQLRDAGAGTVKLQGLYYVVAHGEDGRRGTVYPMPDMHSVLSYNLLTGLHFLRDAVSDLGHFVSSERGVSEGWNPFDVATLQEPPLAHTHDQQGYDMYLRQALLDAQADAEATAP